MLVQRQHVEQIYAPQAKEDLVSSVRKHLRHYYETAPKNFEPYNLALMTLWPSLYLNDPLLFKKIAFEVYVESAQIEGFTIEPEHFQ